jgi:hypothetical protein
MKKISDIAIDLKKELKKYQGAVNLRLADAIGFTVRARMLDLISKGISPILGAGRFPEYKSVTQARVARNVARSARARGKGASAKASLLRAKTAQKKAKQGYPYSVQKKYPGKKPRPVNLFLSGAFLSALTYLTKEKSDGKISVTIGFDDPDQAIKEKGHREGANGQRKRPIIPRQSTESFNQTIRLDITRLIKDAIAKATKRAS